MPKRSQTSMVIASLVVIALAVAIVVYVAQKAGPLYRHPIKAIVLIRATAPTTLPVPVRGVTRRQLRDSWGNPRPGHRHHEGIDIFARRGTEIVSTTPGIVATVGRNLLGGRIVRVLGPGGYWHYYAHLDAYAADLHEGDVIPAGTLLGYVGDSGDAQGTPTHLHYGIYRFQGGAVNPYPFLAPVTPARR